jgi:hypothetical protein
MKGMKKYILFPNGEMATYLTMEEEYKYLPRKSKELRLQCGLL